MKELQEHVELFINSLIFMATMFICGLHLADSSFTGRMVMIVDINSILLLLYVCRDFRKIFMI